MDWFEKLVGFKEGSRLEVQSEIEVSGTTLLSKKNRTQFEIGHFEIISLEALRSRYLEIAHHPKSCKREIIESDVRYLLNDAANKHAVFQVASQTNCLEMVNPNITPEDGVTRYAYDRTQGPICAICAGPSTIYRNHFINLNGEIGQTKYNQIDTFRPLACKLAKSIGCAVDELWEMKNGYLLISEKKLSIIENHLNHCKPSELTKYKNCIQVGVQWNTEITTSNQLPGHLVTQVFCSALPISYNKHKSSNWRNFANLILQANYDATLLVGALNKNDNNNPLVYLTLLGGGAFGNEEAWIRTAMSKAFNQHQDKGLELKLVAYHEPSKNMKKLFK